MKTPGTAVRALTEIRITARPGSPTRQAAEHGLAEIARLREVLARAHKAECPTVDVQTGECRGCYISEALAGTAIPFGADVAALEWAAQAFEREYPTEDFADRIIRAEIARRQKGHV